MRKRTDERRFSKKQRKKKLATGESLPCEERIGEEKNDVYFGIFCFSAVSFINKQSEKAK